MIEVGDAHIVGGRVPEKGVPRFTFNINCQEIYCHVSIHKNKIVDGADDRIIQKSYNVVFAMHDNPDLEEVGHIWELVELHQVGHQEALVWEREREKERLSFYRHRDIERINIYIYWASFKLENIAKF